MRDRYWVVVVLVLLVAVAGLGAVDAPIDESETSTGEPKITVVGGELSFNATTTYARVGEMHGRNFSSLPSATVVLREQPSSMDSYSPSPFEEHLGIEPHASDSGAAAFAQGQRVVLFTDVLESPAQRERVLVHELTHVLQFDQNAPTRVSRRIGDSGADERLMQLSVVEGAATYVEYEYAADHLDEDDQPPTWAERRENRTQIGAFVAAHYHFGHRYVDGRVDSPEELDEVYENPPQTTEQLIHGYGPNEELPADLPVTVEAGDRYEIEDRRTKGELFVRVVLEGELDLDRAADAAAGWGNDELVVLADGDGRPDYAWVLTWDSPDEADEFEAALRDFLDARGTRDGDLWQDDGVTYGVDRAGEESVVLFVGDRGFVADAAATATDRGVTVTVEEGATARLAGRHGATDAVERTPPTAGVA